MATRSLGVTRNDGRLPKKPFENAKKESLVRTQDLFATTHTDHRTGGQEPLSHGLGVTLEDAITLLTAESRNAQELPTTLEMNAEITASHQDLEMTAVYQNANQGHLLAVTLATLRHALLDVQDLLASPHGDLTIRLSSQDRHQPRQLRQPSKSQP
jgi:hypothetical protein